MNLPTVFGIVGWKNSGKTRLMSALIQHFRNQGLKVAALKHSHHLFDIDHSGRDSFQFREAGAHEVLIAGGGRWALIHEGQDHDSDKLSSLLEKLSPVDLVLIEGFKRSPHPKLEVRRREAKETRPLAHEADNIVALVSDHLPLADSLPVFSPDNLTAIAEFILTYPEHRHDTSQS